MFTSKISATDKILPNHREGRTVQKWFSSLVLRFLSICICYDGLLRSVFQFYDCSHLKCRVVVLSVSWKEEVFATNGHASEISSAVLQHTQRETEREREGKTVFLFTFCW